MEKDEDGAAAARVARYAEAIDNVTFGHSSRDADWLDEVTDAVVAVADEEHAALVAEVERLRGLLGRQVLHSEALSADVAREGNRALVAEAKVAKVEALAYEHDHCSGCPTPWWLRAIVEGE